MLELVQEPGQGFSAGPGSPGRRSRHHTWMSSSAPNSRETARQARLSASASRAIASLQSGQGRTGGRRGMAQYEYGRTARRPFELRQSRGGPAGGAPAASRCAHTPSGLLDVVGTSSGGNEQPLHHAAAPRNEGARALAGAGRGAAPRATPHLLPGASGAHPRRSTHRISRLMAGLWAWPWLSRRGVERSSTP
jgi:hypothetical protein